MGPAASKEDEAVETVLQYIISLGEPVSDETAPKGLMAWVRARNLLPTARTSFPVSTRDAVKELFWDEISTGSGATRTCTLLWRLAVGSLQELSPERRELIKVRTALSGGGGTTAGPRPVRSAVGEIPVPAAAQLRMLGPLKAAGSPPFSTVHVAAGRVGAAGTSLAAENEAGAAPAAPLSPAAARSAVSLLTVPAAAHVSTGPTLLGASASLDGAASLAPDATMQPGREPLWIAAMATDAVFGQKTNKQTKKQTTVSR
ncbi:translation initiation factor IF-2-like [Pipra filicauda]|uniref:Translation initiation factor IF-2-like n=1 Tax=Pipra filicauda TaxID=649802 RepID=A0A7R5L8I0_9PASS|nr:translation initiation factor IF-2-like [Pipra filicauda]